MQINGFKHIFFALLIINAPLLHSAQTPEKRTVKQKIHHFLKNGGAAALGGAAITALLFAWPIVAFDHANHVMSKFYDYCKAPLVVPWLYFAEKIGFTYALRWEERMLYPTLLPSDIFCHLIYGGIATIASHQMYKYCTRKPKKDICSENKTDQSGEHTESPDSNKLSH
jgi:hypothetical protein